MSLARLGPSNWRPFDVECSAAAAPAPVMAGAQAQAGRALPALAPARARQARGPVEQAVVLNIPPTVT
ncbi:MAG: hypothetical protein N2689_04920 [Verrucomicrobiae bacterium]|nr:hypothetical protein [Verrucomicrobiae bacterium]